MSTTLYRNKNRKRPRKTPAARAKRIRTQKNRLIALGMAEDKVAKMTDQEVRAALRRPKAIEQAAK